MLYCIVYIRMVSPLCEASLCVSSNQRIVYIYIHTLCNKTVSHLCEFACVLLNYYLQQTLYHIFYMHKVWYRYERSYEFLDFHLVNIYNHNACIGMIFHQCGWACDSSKCCLQQTIYRISCMHTTHACMHGTRARMDEMHAWTPCMNWCMHYEF